MSFSFADFRTIVTMRCITLFAPLSFPLFFRSVSLWKRFTLHWTTLYFTYLWIHSQILLVFESIMKLSAILYLFRFISCLRWLQAEPVYPVGGVEQRILRELNREGNSQA